MAAGKYSFTIEQGATLDFEIQYKDSAGDPISLADYSGRLQIRSNYADNSPTTYAILSSSRWSDGTGLSFSGSDGVTPLASGSIGVYISAASSSALTFNEAVYDLEIQSGSYVIRLLEGKVKLSKEVTR